MNERFVFDTNTLISAFLFKNSIPRKAFSKATKTGILVACSATFNEFREVIFRSKFDKYLTSDLRRAAFDEITEKTLFIKSTESIKACRDPKDDKFLELAVAAKATCIITGDDDLLVLNPFRNISILNPSDFLDYF